MSSPSAYNNLYAELDILGLVKRGVGGGGACMLLALADQAGLGPNGAVELRKRVYDFMSDNRALIEPYFIIDADLPDLEQVERMEEYIDNGDWEGYVEFMPAGRWFGNLELGVASAFLGPIRIVHSNYSRTHHIHAEEGGGEVDGMLFVLHIGGHYQSLRLPDDATSPARLRATLPPRLRVCPPSTTDWVRRRHAHPDGGGDKPPALNRDRRRRGHVGRRSRYRTGDLGQHGPYGEARLSPPP